MNYGISGGIDFNTPQHYLRNRVYQFQGEHFQCLGMGGLKQVLFDLLIAKGSSS